ncbi:hypothetical protein AKG11_31975 [Shinella sp. SUS2]|jgi:hypothetical protein|uniref:hypothetical protein n=1 Tax=unclassified Shinella TaxID=2643062 RepID=UPI00067FC7DC|nr:MULTISPECIES: hypothetical protein [unclassified Shinella]KNY12943.1 hypothetical protein AKG11_31975 [Shinella sp. SUS2]KOC71682.1 hypothetical protein AKG10_31625 [Shinella sp. GWS1]
MPRASPHYHDRVFEFSDICRVLDVNAASLGNWLAIAKMLIPFGEKRGHRRIFDQHEVFVIALLVALHRAGVPVNADAIGTIISASYNPDPIIPEPGALLTVRQTDTAGIVLHAGTIWRDVDTELKEIECQNS